MPGHELLARLNMLFARYGVGRGLYTGDTTIGLKGRIVYEAPGFTALLAAHRALEEAVLSKQQNRFQPDVARKWELGRASSRGRVCQYVSILGVAGILKDKSRSIKC